MVSTGTPELPVQMSGSGSPLRYFTPAPASKAAAQVRPATNSGATTHIDSAPGYYAWRAMDDI